MFRLIAAVLGLQPKRASRPRAVQAAMIHAKGDGIPEDASEAMRWLRAGALGKPEEI